MRSLKIPLLGTYVFLYVILIKNGFVDVRHLLPAALTATPIKIIEPIFLFIVYVGVPLIVGLSFKHFQEIGRKDKFLILVVALIAFDAITKTWAMVSTSQVWQKIAATLGGNDAISTQLIVAIWLIVVFCGWVVG